MRDPGHHQDAQPFAFLYSCSGATSLGLKDPLLSALSDGTKVLEQDGLAAEKNPVCYTSHTTREL
jgi:hypothetical protein